MNLPQRLKLLRTEKGEKQSEIGKFLNYGSSTISGYEIGRNEPTIQGLILLAKYFDVTVDYLIGAGDKKIRFGYGESALHMKMLSDFEKFYRHKISGK